MQEEVSFLAKEGVNRFLPFSTSQPIMESIRYIGRVKRVARMMTPLGALTLDSLS
jgi:hypothetical protein